MSDLDDSLNEPSSRRRSWFDRTAVKSFQIAVEDAARSSREKHAEDEDEEEEEMLHLQHFTRPPRVDFGHVKTGETRRRRLRVSNPLECAQHVTLDRPPAAGFTLDPPALTVAGGQTAFFCLTWTPQQEGSCRQLALLLVDGVYRLQVVMLGTAIPGRTAVRTAAGGSTHDIFHHRNVLTISKSRLSPVKIIIIFDTYL